MSFLIQTNQIPREHLFRQYQKEASEIKHRKAIEKQDRINQERNEIKIIQKELEEEKKLKQRSKLDLINSQKAEYDLYVIHKKKMMREKAINPSSKMDSEPQGTYKIGGENREIKRKNYDEAMNGLNLNPTKMQNIYADYSIQKNLQNQAAAVNRGRSQGYNIINHKIFKDVSKHNYYNYGSEIENYNVCFIILLSKILI